MSTPNLAIALNLCLGSAEYNLAITWKEVEKNKWFSMALRGLAVIHYNL